MLREGIPHGHNDQAIDLGAEAAPVAVSGSSDVLRKKLLESQRRDAFIKTFLPDVRFAMDQFVDDVLLQEKGVTAEIPDDAAHATDTERIIHNAKRRDEIRELFQGVVQLDIGPSKVAFTPWSYDQYCERIGTHIATRFAERQLASLADDHARINFSAVQEETQMLMRLIVQHPGMPPERIIDGHFSQEI